MLEFSERHSSTRIENSPICSSALLWMQTLVMFSITSVTVLELNKQKEMDAHGGRIAQRKKKNNRRKQNKSSCSCDFDPNLQFVVAS